jgi:hypothetical protein
MCSNAAKVHSSTASPLLAASGCTSDSPTYHNRLAPPTPTVTGSTRVISTGGALALEVSTVLTNPTVAPFKVTAGTQCPAVRIFPDPTREPLAAGSHTVADRRVYRAPPTCHGTAITIVRLNGQRTARAGRNDSRYGLQGLNGSDGKRPADGGRQTSRASVAASTRVG